MNLEAVNKKLAEIKAENQAANVAPFQEEESLWDKVNNTISSVISGDAIRQAMGETYGPGSEVTMAPSYMQDLPKIEDVAADSVASIGNIGQQWQELQQKKLDMQKASQEYMETGDRTAFDNSVANLQTAGQQFNDSLGTAASTTLRPVTSLLQPVNDLADNFQKNDVYYQYFLSDEKKMENARRAQQELGIPAEALLSDPAAYRQAMDILDYKDKAENIQNVWEKYPEIKGIADKDPQEAAVVLHDMDTVRKTHGIIETIVHSWNQGKDRLEYDNIQYKIMRGQATQEDMQREAELKEKMEADKKQTPSFFENPLAAIAGGVSQSMPEMLGSMAEGGESAAAMAALSVAFTIATGGTGAAALAGGAALRAALMRAIASQGTKRALQAGMFWGMAKPEMGGRYADLGELKDKDGKPLLSDDERRLYAALGGSANAAIEMFNFGVVANALKPYPHFSKVAKDIVENAAARKTMQRELLTFAGGRAKDTLKVAGSEAGEEALQSISDDVIHNYIVTDKDATHIGTYSLTDIASRAAMSAAEALPGALGFGLLGAAGGSVSKAGTAYRSARREADIVRKYGEDARHTMAGTVMVEQLQQAVKEGNLKETVPDAQKQILRSQLAGTGYEMAYVDVETALQNEKGMEDLKKLADAQGMTNEELQTAIEEKGFLSVPTEVLSQVSSSADFLDSVSFKEGADSIARIRETNKEMVKQYEETIKNMEKRRAEILDTIVKDSLPNATDEQKKVINDAITANPDNPAQGWNTLRKEAQAALDEILAPAMKALQAGMGNAGIMDVEDEQGNKKTVRYTENADWYRNFYKTFKRQPTKQEMEDMAIAMVTGDPSAPKVEGWVPDSAEVEAAMQENRGTIEAIKKDLKTLDSVKDSVKNMTGAEMNLTSVFEPETYKAYKQIMAWAQSVGGATARQARAGAVLAATHAQIIAKRIQKLTGKKYTAEDYIRDKLGFSIRPAGGGLNQLAGEKALTAPQAELEKAKAMEAAGELDQKKIYKETGWIKGKDNKWRFEIPDNLDKIDWNAADNTGQYASLWQIYDNRRLYEAYPDLAAVPVKVVDLPEGNHGRTVRIEYPDGSSFSHIEINRNLADEDKNDTLLHEIQHMIQEKEGFAVGGNTEQVRQQIQQQINALKDKLGKIPHSDEYVKAETAFFSAMESGDREEGRKALKEWGRLNKIVSQEAQDKISELSRHLNELEEAQKEGREYVLYLNLGGEQEARRTSLRAKHMTKLIEARRDAVKAQLAFEREVKNHSREMLDKLFEYQQLSRKMGEGQLTAEEDARYDQVQKEIDDNLLSAFDEVEWENATVEEFEKDLGMPEPHGDNAIIVFRGQEMAMASESKQEIYIDGKKYRSLFGGDGVEADGKVIDDKGAYYAVSALEDEGSVEAAMAELERQSNSRLKGLARMAQAGLEFLKGKNVEFRDVAPVQAKPKAAPQISPEVAKVVEEAKKTYGPFEGEGFNPRDRVPKVRGGWTEKKILKYLKEHGTPYGVREAVNLIAEFDSVEDLKAHMFFHGSAVGASNLKPSITMSDKEIERRGGGGYGEKYWGISVTPSKKIASNFSGESRSVNIYPLILAKNAIVEEAPNLEDAADIAPHIVDYWTRGVDAVWIGDKNAGEQELLILNPRAVVNIGRSDTYDVFQLGTSKNPLRIKDDEAIARMLDVAKALKGKKEGYSYASPKTREEIFFQTAWHGSPYDFETFDLGAIGSGEGAQVHGWGLYFAANRKVSEGYKDRLAWDSKEVIIDGETYFYNQEGDFEKRGTGETIEYGTPLRMAVGYFSTSEGKVKDAIESLQKDIKEATPKKLERWGETWNKAIDILENEGKNWAYKDAKGGKLFQVEIPDEDVMLDEQKTFSQQPEMVKKAILNILGEKDITKEFTKYGAEAEKVAEKIIDTNIPYEDTYELFNQLSDMQIDDKLIDRLDGLRVNLDKYATGELFYRYLSMREGGPKYASELLNQNGVKGITYEGGQDGRCFVVFDDNAIDVIEKYNQQVASQQVQGQTSLLENGKRIVSILETADESTFMHEMAHVFLYDLQELAAIDDESRIELEAVDEWAQWHKGDARKYYSKTPWSKEFAEREQQIIDAEAYGNYDEADRLKRAWVQERFARAFELYLMDGQAPSSRLKAVFRKFKQFLTRLYSVFVNDGARASEPVKRVMDRMVATEDEIQAAELEDRYSDFTKAGGEKLFDESDEETYKRWYAECEEEAKEKLLKIVMQDLEKARQEEYDTKVAIEEERKRAELQQEPVYVAEQAALASGDPNIVANWYPSVQAFEEELAITPPLEEALEEHMTAFKDNLDKELIDSHLSPEAVDKVMDTAKYRNKMEALKSKAMAKKAGLINQINAKAARAMESLEDKLNALPDDMDLKMDAEDAKIKSIMKEINKLRYASKWSKAELGHIEAMIRASTQEEMRNALKKFKDEAKQNKAQEEAVMKANEGRRQIFRELAKESAANKPISDSCNVHYYKSEVKKRTRRVKDMIKARRWDMALQAQEQVGFYTAMVEIAEKNKEQMEKLRAQVTKELNTRTVRLPKDERYWHRHLAYVLRLTPKDAVKPESGIKSLEEIYGEMEDCLDIKERPANVLEMAKQDESFQGYQSLTLEEFKKAVDALHVLYKVGRDKFKMKTKAGKDILDVVAEIIDEESTASASMVDGKKINDDKGGIAYSELIGNMGSIGHLIAKQGQDYILSNLKPENIINMLGEKAHRYIYGTLEKAAEDEAKLQEQNIKALREIMGVYSHKERQDWRKKIYEFSTEGSDKISKENIFAMALQWGTLSNRQRLLGGLAAESTPEAVSDITDEVIQLFRSTMTEKDWLTVQRLWDHVNSYWDMTVKVEEELNGVALEKIPPMAFTVQTADGKTVELAGGYMPVDYNPEKSSKAAEQDINKAAKAGMAGAQRMGAGRSFTKARSEHDIFRALRLDFSTIENHLQDVIHNATYRIPVRDVYRIITNLKFENHVVEHLGREAHNILKDWVLDAWKQDLGSRGTADNLLSRSLAWLRSNSTMAIMGYRLWPVIENLSNISISIDKIGAGQMAAALGDFYTAPAENMARVKNLSIFMRNRLENMDRDIRSQTGIFRARNKLAEFASEHAYDLMVYSDLMVSAPLWLRSYKNSYAPSLEAVKKENEENIAYVLNCQQELDTIKAQITDLQQETADMENHLKDRRYASPETAEMLRQSPFAVHSDNELRALSGENKKKLKELEKELWKAEVKFQEAQEIKILSDDEILAETERRAVYAADGVIRDTFGSGRIQDLSSVQRSKNELTKLLTTFYSFFNTQFNALFMAYTKSRTLPGANAITRWMPFAKAVIFRVAGTALIGSTLQFAMGLAGGDDEDKKRKEKDAEGKDVTVEVPAFERWLKVFAKNTISTSVGSMYFVRDIVGVVSDYVISGKQYGLNTGSVATRSLGEFGKMFKLMAQKGEKDATIQAQQEKKEQQHQEKLAKLKGKKRQEYLQKWEEEQKYQKPPKRITYAEIAGHGLKGISGMTANYTGLTSTLVNAITGTMQYLTDTDMRYDPTMKNIIWSALFDKKPVERVIPEKPKAEKKETNKKWGRGAQ